jgi:hypothetical protein
LLFVALRRVSCGLSHSAPAQCQHGRKGTAKGLLTLMVFGDSGLMSNVANAGELVSPALISPPSPLDRRRDRGLSMLLGPERGASLSGVVLSSGKASVAVIFTVESRMRRKKD